MGRFPVPPDLVRKRPSVDLGRPVVDAEGQHLIRNEHVANKTFDALGDLPRPNRSDAAHFGAIRMAPSRRITSPLSIGLMTIDSTRSANSAGRPRRLGKGTCLPSES